MERRIEALKELSRVLRIGGKLMVSVWAMEQRHRKFDSQDVLVPWNNPTLSSSDDKTSSIERDLNSTTTTTSDDDATHYHAYTQTSDSDSFPSLSRECRRRVGRVRHRGRSIDPHYPSSSHSSSDLSSPNESCYSFVRRALQKLAGNRGRSRAGRTPWFLQGFDDQDELNEPFAAVNDDNMDDFLPMQLRQLESTEFAELVQLQEAAHNRLVLSNALSPRRRRTLETTCGLQQKSNTIQVQPKSKSLSDLFGLIPMSLFRGGRNPIEHFRRSTHNNSSSARKSEGLVESGATLAEELWPDDVNIHFPDFVRHKAVQTDSYESLEMIMNGSSDGKVTIKLDSDSSTLSASVEHSNIATSTSYGAEKDRTASRPVLVKQKQSLPSSPFSTYQSSPLTQSALDNSSDPSENRNSLISNSSDETSEQSGGKRKRAPSFEKPETSLCWKDIQQSVKNLPEFKSSVSHPSGQPPRANHALSSIWKQTSLNEDLIFTDRIKEKEKLKQNIQKQCSLNEELIFTRRENTRWDQMKEAFFNHSNVKRIQLLKTNLSNRFRNAEAAEPDTNVTGGSSSGLESIPSPSQPTMRQVIQGSSLRNGFARMLKNWKTTDENVESSGAGSLLLGSRRGSKESGQRRGLFSPFFLRRSSMGSLNVGKNDGSIPMSPLTSPPYMTRRPSENEVGLENGGNGSGKLLLGVRHVRKLSREEGSDSSKDSSFQSDTSVDSEDSFASVIFIPRPNSANKCGSGNENCFFNSETRANSTDSDRSPKSPASKLSPPNYNTPKSPSPLASSELLTRRKSPDESPTRFAVPVTSLFQDKPAKSEPEAKFVFDKVSEVINKKETRNQQSGTDSGQVTAYQSIQATCPTTSTVSRDEKVATTAAASKGEEKSGARAGEKIVVLRKPGVVSESKAITRQQVRRSLPKELALELFNPETDDVDTSDTSSSSPNSVSSVVSVLNEESAQQVPSSLSGLESSKVLAKDKSVQETTASSLEQLQQKSCMQETLNESDKPSHFEHSSKLPVLIESDNEKNEDESCEARVPKIEARKSKVFSSSVDSLFLSSSPKTRRRSSAARFGNTSEWLHSLPSDMLSSDQSHPKRSTPERRTSGEKMLFGEVKKQKGPDAKWPASITDESPPIKSEDEAQQAASGDTLSYSSGEPVTVHKTMSEEMEEKESLFDSIENLANKQQPSRNPSLDSSLRIESKDSTCSCSIRGGDSFDSWTSAKSSLTNSSSTHHKSSYPTLFTLPVQASNMAGSSEGAKRTKRLDPSKTWSTGTEDTEDSAVHTYHRYYHVFQEGELDKLIEKYVQNLHVISSYYDHANWCIIAEKVHVWTI